MKAFEEVSRKYMEGEINISEFRAGITGLFKIMGEEELHKFAEMLYQRPTSH